MADVVQWHFSRVAACVLVLFYVNRRTRNRKRWKNRKFWTKPYISRNPSLGAYNTLVQELRTEDAAAFKNFLRMDQTCFDERGQATFTETRHQHAKEHPSRRKVGTELEIPCDW